MSRQAIAAVLARTDLVSGERLVAFSLASFAGRENRAWPGAPAASARAGLSRSRYQQAREALVARGLVAVDERATGRGRASTVTLVFADTGPWWDGEINVEVFEGVLAFSRARGPERLLLATMAPVADDEDTVRDLSIEELRAAAGITDRHYRRAQQALLASGELVLAKRAVGRGNTNVWTVLEPRRGDGALPARVERRVTPPVGSRPLVGMAGSRETAATPETQDGIADGKGGQDRTVSEEKCPIRTGVFSPKRRSGSDTFRSASGGKPGRKPGRKPGKNPGRKPGSQRAHGKGTREPGNQKKTPLPP